MSSGLYIDLCTSLIYSKQNRFYRRIGMKSYEFLIVFSGKFRKILRPETSPRIFSFELPMVKVFSNQDDAEQWAVSNEVFFYDPELDWAKKKHNIYNLAKICSRDHFLESINPFFKNSLKDDLERLVFQFMADNYQSQFRVVMMKLLGDNEYSDIDKRNQAFAKFIQRPLELQLANQLTHYKEFFSGDVGVTIENALIQFFTDYEPYEESVADKAVGRR